MTNEIKKRIFGLKEEYKIRVELLDKAIKIYRNTNYYDFVESQGERTILVELIDKLEDLLKK